MANEARGFLGLGPSLIRGGLGHAKRDPLGGPKRGLFAFLCVSAAAACSRCRYAACRMQPEEELRHRGLDGNARVSLVRLCAFSRRGFCVLKPSGLVCITECPCRGEGGIQSGGAVALGSVRADGGHASRRCRPRRRRAWDWWPGSGGSCGWAWVTPVTSVSNEMGWHSLSVRALIV